VVLANRGFGRAEWVAACQGLNFHFLVRIGLDVTIHCARHRGVLSKYPTRKGMAQMLRDARYRKHGRVIHNVVVRWGPGLPRKRDEPWS
jgi:hypothetical protein